MDEQRIKTVRRNLANRGLEQMLVCDPRSIHYLTGAFIEPGERFLGLIVGSDARPTLVLNALFAAPADAACTVRSFTDTDDPLAIVEGLCDADKPLGCDKNLPARFLLPLMERGAASGFVLASDAVDDARAIKDDTERELMRAASAANDAAMDRFRRLVHEGVTEADVAGQLEAIYRELGAQGHSFTPIVSFGANAADPHHEPDDTPLASGDVVLFDVGCRKGEYCSDMTRTFVFGEPSEKLREVHDTVRRANEAARKLVAPGVRFCDIDAAARSIIEEAGYGSYFTHRLGHQIGLDVHEPGDRARRAGASGHGVLHRAGHLPARRVRRAHRGPRAGHRRRLRSAQQLPPRAGFDRLAQRSHRGGFSNANAGVSHETPASCLPVAG